MVVGAKYKASKNTKPRKFPLPDIDDCTGKTCSGVGQCEDGINDYTCKCNQGYSGKDCQTSKQLPKIPLFYTSMVLYFIAVDIK